MSNTNHISEKSDFGVTLKKLLADYLGIEPDDIDNEDNLLGDLHMRPSDLSDFMEILNEKGMDTKDIELTEIETVGELLEALSVEIE